MQQANRPFAGVKKLHRIKTKHCGAVHFCVSVVKAVKAPQKRKGMVLAVPPVHPEIHLKKVTTNVTQDGSRN